jgi:hypothetical protein
MGSVVRFDAYAGTIKGDRPFQEVAQVLAHDLDGIVVRGKPVKRFGEVLRVERAGHCAVWVGKDHGNGSVYFEGKGESSPDLVTSVRSRFEHGVSRADVADDWNHETAFDRLQAIVRQHKGPQVAGAYEKLPDDPTQGRTWAAGRRGSNAYIRVYEAGKMKERLHFNKPHWVRGELECRPHYAADKVAAASMSPVDFWGMSPWTRRVAEALFEIDVPRYEVEYRPPTHDKTRVYLANTFRRFWETCIDDGQDGNCILADFKEIWRQSDEIEAASKRS